MIELYNLILSRIKLLLKDDDLCYTNDFEITISKVDKEFIRVEILPSQPEIGAGSYDSWIHHFQFQVSIYVYTTRKSGRYHAYEVTDKLTSGFRMRRLDDKYTVINAWQDPSDADAEWIVTPVQLTVEFDEHN